MEEFYQFTQTLNPITAENMKELLFMESDFKTMQIIYNSMDESKNDRTRIRETLCPSMGYLYPMYYHHLKQVDTLEDMRIIMKGFNEYRVILSDV